MRALVVPIVALAVMALALHWSLWVWGPSPAGDRIALRHDGVDRSYLFHAPPSVAGDPPAPRDLVIVLHGAKDFAKRIAESTGWSRLADEAGFLVAYPEGTHPIVPRLFESWNAGHCCMEAAQQGVDDVGFIEAVATDVRARYDVDRVFLAGFSNGGMLAYRIAAEHPDRVDGIGVVAATLWSGPEGGEPAWTPPATLAPVPVMHIHGTRDQVVPIDGRVGDTVSGWVWAPMERSLAPWIQAWGLSAGNTTQQGPVERTESTANGIPVVVGVRHAHGHSWPGSQVPFFLSTPEPDYDATRELWAFFDAQRHR